MALIDFDILKQYGTDNHAIRRLFTAKEGDKLHKFRTAWEEKIQDRIDDGIRSTFQVYPIYAAADMAWDGPIITRHVVPLIQYAQGKIGFERACSYIEDSEISEELKEKFCELDPKTREIKSIDMGGFVEIAVNMGRSFVQRRHAAQVARRLAYYPFFKYDPRSTSYVAKLRGDVLSQTIEVIVDQFGYRHLASQIIRDFLLYPHVVVFPSQGWIVNRQLQRRVDGDGNVIMTEDEDGIRRIATESEVIREGIPMVNPHPSRVFYDSAFPLSSINHDGGCRWVGFWDIKRFGEIAYNPHYFNREEIPHINTLSAVFDSYQDYFDAYFPCKIDWPSRGSADVAGMNDREKNVGLYTANDDDYGIALTEYREKVIPADVGLGDYPYPVWVRLVVANERTVVYGEILPSLPAVYFGYNESDNREVNQSFMHEVLPWQDQASNMLTQLLYTQKQSLLKVITMNLDAVSPKMRAEFRKIMKGDAYLSHPLVIEYSAEAARSLGIDPKEVMQIHEADQIRDVSLIFRSLLQLTSLAERMMNFSPQELGQPSPREISATEVLEIANTTQTTYQFIGRGLEYGFDAMKQMLYESLIAKGEGRVVAPVSRRYRKETIERAGFQMLQEDEEAIAGSTLADPRGMTVIGTYDRLVYAYNFTSRDGYERVSDQRSAEILTQLLPQLAAIPQVAERIGMDGFYKIINSIVRMSGAGVDLALELQEGEDNEVAVGEPSGQVQDLQAVVGEIINELRNAEQQGANNQAQIDALSQLLTQMTGGAGRLEAGQTAPQGPIQPVSDVDQLQRGVTTGRPPLAAQQAAELQE